MKIVRAVSKLAAGSAVAAFAALGSAGLAQADGMAGKGKGRVAYEAPWNWSGLYFGVHSGYSWSDYDNVYRAAPLIDGRFQQFSHDTDNPVVGGQIGLQHQFGQIVLGVEASVSSAVLSNNSGVQCPNPATICAGWFNDVISVGPRIGYAMGKWMPYVTGGYASVGFDHNVRVKGDSEVGTVRGHDRTNGWYIGGGVDMALKHGWTIGIEYRHYELEDFSSTRFGATGTLIPGDNPASVDASLDTVTLRVSWKLGRPEAAPLK